MFDTLNGETTLLTYDASTHFAWPCATIHIPPPTTLLKAGVVATDTCFVGAFGQSKSEQRNTSRAYVLLLLKTSKTTVRLARDKCHEKLSVGG